MRFPLRPTQILIVWLVAGAHTRIQAEPAGWSVAGRVPTQAVQFVWSGAATPTSAVVKAKLMADDAVARLAIDIDSNFMTPVFSPPDTAVTADNNRVVTLPIAGLAPNTQYYYAVEVDGAIDMPMRGRLHTLPAEGPASFTIAFASCANTGSSHRVFDTIRRIDPLFFLHTGDFHYLNIAVNNRDVFRAAYETVLASPAQSTLYRNVPIVYIWDDHDYGPNNSDSTAPGRLASRLTYQEYVPHHPLAAGTGNVPIYRAITVGRARLIITDSRSARSPASAPDNLSKTMLGATQKAWFKQQLLDARRVYPLIVWVNTLPWIGLTGDDGWHLYTNERREIANFIRDNRIPGLCMLSGDAHMLAIDDGTNSDYATGGGASFPVMHAAALDRSGSVKGGPYSEGAFPGLGQFGLMTVTDTGGRYISVQWSGRNADNREIVGLTFSVFAGYGPDCDCSEHGDLNSDMIFDSVDIVAMVDYVFRGGMQPVADAACPHNHRGDVDCDAVDDVLDIVRLVDHALRSGPPPCNPCACWPYPDDCAA